MAHDTESHGVSSALVFINLSAPQRVWSPMHVRRASCEPTALCPLIARDAHSPVTVPPPGPAHNPVSAPWGPALLGSRPQPRARPSGVFSAPLGPGHRRLTTLTTPSSPVRVPPAGVLQRETLFKHIVPFLSARQNVRVPSFLPRHSCDLCVIAVSELEILSVVTWR